MIGTNCAGSNIAHRVMQGRIVPAICTGYMVVIVVLSTIMVSRYHTACVQLVGIHCDIFWTALVDIKHRPHFIYIHKYIMYKGCSCICTLNPLITMVLYSTVLTVHIYTQKSTYVASKTEYILYMHSIGKLNKTEYIYFLVVSIYCNFSVVCFISY